MLCKCIWSIPFKMSRDPNPWRFNAGPLIHSKSINYREACIGFKELWKKKHGDDLWIKEVAAMQSCLPPALSFSGSSGNILANEIPTPDQNNIDNSKGSLTHQILLHQTKKKRP